MRLAADKLDAAALDERPTVLNELQERFDFPINIAGREELPDWPRGRIARGEDIAFYSPDPRPNDHWFAATPLSNGSEIVRLGPAHKESSPPWLISKWTFPAQAICHRCS